MDQTQVQAEEVADMITSWDTDEELFDEEDEDAIQLVECVFVISCQISDDSSDEDSDEEKREKIGT